MHQALRLRSNGFDDRRMTAADTVDSNARRDVDEQIAIGILHGDAEALIEDEWEVAAAAGHRLDVERAAQRLLRERSGHRGHHLGRTRIGEGFQFGFSNHLFTRYGSWQWADCRNLVGSRLPVLLQLAEALTRAAILF